MKSFPDPVFTPVAENIKANREDERKSLFYGFASRQRSIARRVLSEKLDYADSYQLLMSEATNLEILAAELNHV